MSVDETLGKNLTIQRIDQLCVSGFAENGFRDNRRYCQCQNRGHGDATGRTGLCIHDFPILRLCHNIQLLQHGFLCLIDGCIVANLCNRINTHNCQCNAGTNAHLCTRCAVGITAFCHSVDVGCAFCFQCQFATANAQNHIFFNLCVCLRTDHMNSHRTGNAEVTGGVTGERACIGGNLFGSGCSEADTLSRNGTLGDGCLVGVLGDSHIHTNTGRECLGIGGSGTTLILGEFTADHNGCFGTCYSFQCLTFGHTFCQRVLIDTIAVQTQRKGLLCIVCKLKGNLQRIGYQSVAGIGSDRHEDGLALIYGRSDRNQTAGGLCHIRLGSCCTGARAGSRTGSAVCSRTNTGRSICADLIGFVFTQTILDAKTNQCQFSGSLCAVKLSGIEQIGHLETVNTIAFAGNRNFQLQVNFLGHIANGFNTVAHNGNDHSLTGVISCLRNIQNHLIIAVSGAFHFCQGTGARRILLELTDAQATVLSGCGSVGIRVKDLQLNTLVLKLDGDVAGRHDEGETAGAVVISFHGFGLSALGVGDDQTQVITCLIHIVIVLVGFAVQRTLLDGVNNHGTAAAGLGIAAVVSSRHTADLIAVFSLACRFSLLNGVENRQILCIHIDLVFFEAIDLYAFNNLLTCSDVIGCGSDLRCVFIIFVLGDDTADFFGSIGGSYSGNVGIPYLINIVTFPGIQCEHDLLRSSSILFIRRRTVGHLAIDNSKLDCTIVAVLSFLLCSDLVLNGCTTIIDIDIGSRLGISVNGGCICH